MNMIRNLFGRQFLPKIRLIMQIWTKSNLVLVFVQELIVLYDFIRHTDRKTSAVHHFNQALLMNPLLWAAYEELCKLGAAIEATTVFGESAFEYIQKQYTSHDVAPQLQASSDDHNVVSGQHLATSASPRQLKHLPGNIMKDSENHHGAILSGNSYSQLHNGGHANMSFYNTPSPMATQLSSMPAPPMCRNMLPICPNFSSSGIDGSPRSTVNPMIQIPRRKLLDEGKLRKVGCLDPIAASLARRLRESQSTNVLHKL